MFGFRSLRKPNEIKGSGVRRVHKGDTISSQARYDHFETLPDGLFGTGPEKQIQYTMGGGVAQAARKKERRAKRPRGIALNPQNQLIPA